jgi:hypothetical protein
MEEAPLSLLDYNFVGRYYPDTGFKASVDGLHKLPKGVLTKVIFQLSPPAGFYQDPKLTEDVLFTTMHDFSSPQKSPRFLDDFFPYRDIVFDPRLLLIIEVQSVKFDRKGEMSHEPIGWGLLPIFHEEGYVDNGSFHIPLYQGAPKKELLTEMQFDEPISIIERELCKGRKSSVKYLGQASAFVRIVDSQFEDIFNMPQPDEITAKPCETHFQEYEGTYLPEDTRLRGKYEYIPAKVKKEKSILSKLLPKGVEEKDFQKSMNQKFAEMTEITHMRF